MAGARTRTSCKPSGLQSEEAIKALLPKTNDNFKKL